MWGKSAAAGTMTEGSFYGRCDRKATSSSTAPASPPWRVQGQFIFIIQFEEPRQLYQSIPANDADIVGVPELLLGGVRVVHIHVIDRPARQDDVVEGLLEGAHR